LAAGSTDTQHNEDIIMPLIYSKTFEIKPNPDGEYEALGIIENGAGAIAKPGQRFDVGPMDEAESKWLIACGAVRRVPIPIMEDADGAFVVSCQTHPRGVLGEVLTGGMRCKVVHTADPERLIERGLIRRVGPQDLMPIPVVPDACGDYVVTRDNRISGVHGEVFAKGMRCTIAPGAEPEPLIASGLIGRVAAQEAR
jgi:hypothetical protein